MFSISVQNFRPFDTVNDFFHFHLYVNITGYACNIPECVMEVLTSKLHYNQNAVKCLFILGNLLFTLSIFLIYKIFNRYMIDFSGG